VTAPDEQRPDEQSPDGQSPDEQSPDGQSPDEARPEESADEPLDVVVPDDLSGLLDGGEETPTVALVVTQVAAPEPLAAACALARVEIDAVPTEVGAVAVLRDAAAAEAGVTAISQLLRQLPVVLLTRREGQITAERWVGGRKDDELPAGLVLSDAPGVLEDLLLGVTDAASVEGAVSSVGMSRWQAMRALARSRKR